MKTCLTALYIFPFAGNQRESESERKKRKNRTENTERGVDVMYACTHVCMYVCVRAYKCDRVAIVS